MRDAAARLLPELWTTDKLPARPVAPSVMVSSITSPSKCLLYHNVAPAAPRAAAWRRHFLRRFRRQSLQQKLRYPKAIAYYRIAEHYKWIFSQVRGLRLPRHLKQCGEATALSLAPASVRGHRVMQARGHK